MSSTYTSSQAETFTITNAKYLASKIQTDLQRLHRFYYDSHRQPTMDRIQSYYEEMVLLQKFNFLLEIEYGFSIGNQWKKALKYEARQGGVLASDDDPGGVRYTAIPSNAEWSSFLRYNNRWNSTAYESDKKEFLRLTPIRRTTGSEYSGTWTQERSYASGGRGLLRSGI